MCDDDEYDEYDVYVMMSMSMMMMRRNCDDDDDDDTIWYLLWHLDVILRDDLDEEVWSESKPESSPSSRLSPLSPDDYNSVIMMAMMITIFLMNESGPKNTSKTFSPFHVLSTS